MDRHMKVITKTLVRPTASLTFRAQDDRGSTYLMTSAEWVELGKPDRIVVQISTPAEGEVGI